MNAPQPDGRAHAIAFRWALQDAVAQRRVAVPGGHVLLDARLPLLWDANRLRVEAAAAPDVDALVAAADTHFAGLAFRAIDVPDPAVAEVLAAPLEARGYIPHHELLMLLGPTPTRPAPDDPAVGVEQIAPGLFAAGRVTAAREQLGDERVGVQLAAHDELIAAATIVRSFAAFADGRPVARCQLYGDGSTMQVENVYTDESYRGRGLASALVAHAAYEARAAGAEVVFLTTDVHGAAQRLYRRLGFADAGLQARYRRVVEAAAPASSQSSRPPSSSASASSS